MKYYIDTEFVEGYKQPYHRILDFRIPFDKPIPTIDLISIGIVDENGREFYAINADVDVEFAWSNEWVRQNVLLRIWQENFSGDQKNRNDFSIATMKWVFKTEGRTLKELSHDIQLWIINNQPIDFYGYYCDYDWVVFCQIFGSMMQLPKGFPMYCYDLKQMMDTNWLTKDWKRSHCPDPEGEHNALVDAHWNKKLHDEINWFINQGQDLKPTKQGLNTATNNTMKKNINFHVRGENEAGGNEKETPNPEGANSAEGVSEPQDEATEEESGSDAE